MDSVLPDGTPLTIASAPDDDDEDDDDESGPDAEWTCACTPLDEEGASCSVDDGDDCDCVAQFGGLVGDGEIQMLIRPGNFYSTSTDGGCQTLDLQALPVKLPLVECSPTCPCGTTCANRVTQRGVQ